MEKGKKNTDVVTIYDVAKEADVSLATVSRVINNSAVVREERRERVEAAIKKLNFKPNEIARGLARKKSTNIGVIVSDIYRGEVTELLAGIVDTANLKQYGYALSINSYLGDEEDFKIQVERMISSQVDGLLVMCDTLTENMHDVLVDTNTPLVLFATPNTYPDLYTISINYAKVGKEIVTYFNSQNYKQVSILSRTTDPQDCGVIKSFVDESKNKGIVTETIQLPAAYDKAYAFLAQQYDGKTVPSAVFATNDTHALAYSNYVQDRGLVVPSDVEIISFSNTQSAVMGRPQLTSVMYPVYRIGAYAMSVVTKLINEEALNSIPSLEDDYEIIWRGSTK